MLVRFVEVRCGFADLLIHCLGLSISDGVRAFVASVRDGAALGGRCGDAAGDGDGDAAGDGLFKVGGRRHPVET